MASILSRKAFKMAWLVKARSNGNYKIADLGRPVNEQLLVVNSHEFTEFILKPKVNEKIFFVEEKQDVKVEEKLAPVILQDDPTPQPKSVEVVEAKEPEKKHIFKIKKKRA